MSAARYVQSRPNTKNERRKELIDKYSKTYKEAVDKGIEIEYVREVLFLTDTLKNSSKALCDEDTSDCLNTGSRSLNLTLSVSMVMVGICCCMSASLFYNNKPPSEYLSKKMCALKNYEYIHEIFRPVVNCSMCRSLTEVPIERHLSVEDFRIKYAYTSVPVIVKEATRDWTALTTYSFQFFKDLYLNTEGSLMYREGGCMSFMPWKSNLNSLDEFFNMSDARANMEEGEAHWYIGWMNCIKKIQTVLRQHYTRPYFLPDDTESSVVNWIFMGWPGPGVTLHVDKLHRPSWQAQISGTKTWTLVPTPECYSTCSNLTFTVYKGDIVVFNGNHWYHTTRIEPGEISISIGSEYD